MIPYCKEAGWERAYALNEKVESFKEFQFLIGQKYLLTTMILVKIILDAHRNIVECPAKDGTKYNDSPT